MKSDVESGGGRDTQHVMMFIDKICIGHVTLKSEDFLSICL